MKQILLIILLGTGISITAQTLSLSFDDALRQMQQGNRSLKIADKGIEAARAERDKLNALWYPSLQGAGTFVHLSEKIEVKQPLSQFTDPAKDFVHNLVPDDQFISGILDQIGSHTLVFPLAPRNLTTVGLTAEWIVFSGGKRIRAGKIGNTMIDMARENREQTDATQRILLAESYFGLRLAQEVVRVRQDTYNSLQQHYKNALKLEAAGMIDKAGRLFAQVNMDEAQRSLEASQKEAAVLQNALRTLLNMEDTCTIQPISPTLHQHRPSCSRGVLASHADRELHRQPIAVAVAHRQATAPYRPERIPARHCSVRQTDLICTWYSKQPRPPHHDRSRIYLEPL